MIAEPHLQSAMLPGDGPNWIAPHHEGDCGKGLGLREAPGGVHLSKTMMLAELTAVMEALSIGKAAQEAVVSDNVLAKATGAARRLALSRLNTLYGIRTPLPLQAVALRLWPRSTHGRPLVALLCALAREPLLRETAAPILDAPTGAIVRWPDLAVVLERRHPGRYSPKMMKSLAQNCASSWTQSGHLKGKVSKRRARAEPSAEAAAFAALLGTMAGFGGPALLRSPWMLALDRSEAELLSLLRRAEATGLAKVRAGGGVVQISVGRPMAELLEVPEFAHF